MIHVFMLLSVDTRLKTVFDIDHRKNGTSLILLQQQWPNQSLSTLAF